jgi:hypothetical protein
MIPLERWNVERKVTSCGKREVLLWITSSSRASKRLVDNGGKFYVPPMLARDVNADTIWRPPLLALGDKCGHHLLTIFGYEGVSKTGNR